MSTTKYDTAGDFTWTWPVGETVARVQTWGGGSGGESGFPGTRGGAGGPGGGYHREKNVVKTSPAATLTVHIGAGGNAGAAGDESWVKQNGVYVSRASGGGTPSSGGGVAGAGFDLSGTDVSTHGGKGGAQGFGLFPVSDAGRGGGCSGGNVDSGDAPPFGSSIGARAPGGGLAGYGGSADPAADGQDAPERGGGGGGGAKGKTSGKGHAGAVWITCPVPTVAGLCCCDRAEPDPPTTFNCDTDCDPYGGCVSTSCVTPNTVMISGSCGVPDGPYGTTPRYAGGCVCFGDCGLLFDIFQPGVGSGQACIGHDTATGVTVISVCGDTGDVQWYDEFYDPDGAIYCGTTGVLLPAIGAGCGTATWN